MPGKSWTTDEQVKFLLNYVPQYRETQANGSLSSVFWPLIYREWFQTFPEKAIVSPGCEELTEEQEVLLKSRLEERRKMLRTWFRWRGNNTVRKKGGFFLAGSTSKKRHLHDTEAYSKLFYQSKLKGLVEAESVGASLTHSEKLAKILEVTKREWANESEEVKALVKAKKGELENDRKPDLDDSAMPSSPEKYQAAIDDLDSLANNFFEHLKKTTNWTGFLVVGGPKPDIGGEIALASFFTDSGLEHQAFQMFLPTFGSDIIVPFGNYLKTVYSNTPPSSCAMAQNPAARPDSHQATSSLPLGSALAELSQATPMNLVSQPTISSEVLLEPLPMRNMSMDLLSLPWLPAPPSIAAMEPTYLDMNPDISFSQFGDAFPSRFPHSSHALSGDNTPINFDVPVPSCGDALSTSYISPILAPQIGMPTHHDTALTGEAQGDLVLAGNVSYHTPTGLSFAIAPAYDISSTTSPTVSSTVPKVSLNFLPTASSMMSSPSGAAITAEPFSQYGALMPNPTPSPAVAGDSVRRSIRTIMPTLKASATTTMANGKENKIPNGRQKGGVRNDGAGVGSRGGSLRGRGGRGGRGSRGSHGRSGGADVVNLKSPKRVRKT